MKLLQAVALIAVLTSPVAAGDWKTLKNVPAQPLTPTTMDTVKGKATPLQLFLSQATQTSLGGGVILYTFNPSGASGSYSASWNTGSSTGSSSGPLP